MTPANESRLRVSRQVILPKNCGRKAYNAVAEQHNPVRVEHVTMPFARQVLDWVADHLGSSTG